MPASTPLAQVIFVAALSVAAILAAFVYPIVSVVRAARAKPRALRWAWALATLVPGLVCIALMHGQELVGLVVNWIVWLVLLWRARALAWRASRRWSTPTLAVITLLMAAYVGHGWWKQHDPMGTMRPAHAPAASS